MSRSGMPKWGNWYGWYEPRDEPEWFDEWRLGQIERAKRNRVRSEEELRGALVEVFREAAPVSVAEARAKLRSVDFAFDLKGDVWLARRLIKAGFVVPMPRRNCGRIALTVADERLLEVWSTGLRRSAVASDVLTLDELHLELTRWAASRDPELPYRIGHRKMSVWLQESGFPSVRRSHGRVFTGLLRSR